MWFMRNFTLFYVMAFFVINRRYLLKSSCSMMFMSNISAFVTSNGFKCFSTVVWCDASDATLLIIVHMCSFVSVVRSPFVIMPVMRFFFIAFTIKQVNMYTSLQSFSSDFVRGISTYPFSNFTRIFRFVTYSTNVRLYFRRFLVLFLLFYFYLSNLLYFSEYFILCSVFFV